VTVYVSRDSAARSVGADPVANAIRTAAAAQGRPVTLVRNGSRGMLWLEPLVEVVTPEGRIGYGPMAPSDVAGLMDAGLLDGADHPLRLGVVDDIPWLARQSRVTFARVGITDPLSPEDYERHGGLAGLRRALQLSPADVVTAVTESGLRGRGGAGFPAGVKWKTVLDCAEELKFVCCTADEGDSGTFADRMVMEGDPFMLIEGMTIAAHAVGRQYNVGAQTRRTGNVAWHPEDVLELHPLDAENRGITDGDMVTLASRVGSTTLRARVSDRMPPGVVYTTFHHPVTGANVVTTENSDWATNCPEYKVTAVQVGLAHPLGRHATESVETDRLAGVD
jgi:formylmethanofuran dehydrogenase subunit D